MAQKIFAVGFSVVNFTKNWDNCNILSNYVAKIISFGQSDPFLFSNLLSTITNEVLEVFYNNHYPEGNGKIFVYEEANMYLLELSVPADSTIKESYTQFLKDILADKETNKSNYIKKLLITPIDNNRSLSFLSLAADYGIQSSISSESEKEIKILLKIPKENFRVQS